MPVQTKIDWFFFIREIHEWVQFVNGSNSIPTSQINCQLCRITWLIYFFCAQMHKIPIYTFAIRSSFIDDLWTQERQRRVRFNTWTHSIQVRAQSRIMPENFIKFTITYFPYQSRVNHSREVSSRFYNGGIMMVDGNVFIGIQSWAVPLSSRVPRMNMWWFA